MGISSSWLLSDRGVCGNGQHAKNTHKRARYAMTVFCVGIRYYFYRRITRERARFFFRLFVYGHFAFIDPFVDG